MPPPVVGFVRHDGWLGVAAVCLVVAAVVAVAVFGPPASGIAPTGAEERIVEMTNDERTAAGVSPAASNATLSAVARAHSRDMRDRGFVDHTNPDGEDPRDRLAAVGVDCAPGENIYESPRGMLAATDEALARHVVDAWLDSPGHRETLLRARYDRQGVGVAVGDHAVYVTQVFC